MRLFDKYLLACTNQRIPMPPEWQESLELSLSAVKQSKMMGGAQAELTGYKFQQDDNLQRGFVHQQVKSLQLNEQAKYLFQLYLRAIKDHKGLDFLSYLQLGTAEYKFPYYTTTAPIIEGRKYSVYGNTIREAKWQIYLDGNDKVLEEGSVDYLSTIKPLVIDTSLLGAGEQQEFLMLKVISYVPIAIVEGVFDKLPTTKSVIKKSKELNEETGKEEEIAVEELTTNLSAQRIRVEGGTVNYWPVHLPSVAYRPQLDYADKLIPALLDMQITVESPSKQIELLAEALKGKDTEEQIKINTIGLYDVDKYMGGKLIW